MRLDFNKDYCSIYCTILCDSAAKVKQIVKPLQRLQLVYSLSPKCYTTLKYICSQDCCLQENITGMGKIRGRGRRDEVQGNKEEIQKGRGEERDD